VKREIFLINLVEDAIKDVEVVLNPELQPFTYFDFQISNESLKPETNYELIQNNSVPLCFNSFQILKETLEQVLKDKYIKSQEISFESMQQSCQSFQDPIADRLDDLCCQSHFPSSSHGIKSCYDIGYDKTVSYRGVFSRSIISKPIRKVAAMSGNA
jgi:hypothetical protein